MLKVINCPNCGERITFSAKKDDVDHTGRYPTPIYVKHMDPSCNKWCTVYFDSKMRVSLTFKGKEDTGDKWEFVKDVESN